MVLGCPAAIVTLFLLELNCTLYQGLPADPSDIPIENHELVVSRSLQEGSSMNSHFNNVSILHVQDDPAYNPYFALHNQSGMLYNKIPINISQTNSSFSGTFLMAVNKQNKSLVETLYCVTYCIGNLSDPTIHETCYNSIYSGALTVSRNGTLFSQHIYKLDINQNTPVGYTLLQLSLTPGNKSNMTFHIVNHPSRLFFVDFHGVLRTGRNVTGLDVGVHILKIAAASNASGILQLDVALVTVNVTGDKIALNITFEQPNGYMFSVKEGKQGLSVGLVKAIIHHEGLEIKVVYSFGKQQDASFFQLNQTSGEIKTAVPLDRETNDSHVFSVVATVQSSLKPVSYQVEVHVLVEDVNDNPPVFIQNEYSLSLSLYTQPGLLLRVNATDEDVDQNAMMVYTITEGDDKELFWINSTSGELFLVAPLTVTADDSIVLVVEAKNTVQTDVALQDTVLVRMTFYDVVPTAGRESSVALVSGVSVSSFLVIAGFVGFGLYTWRKRRMAQNQRSNKKALSITSTGEMTSDSEPHTNAVDERDRKARSEIYQVVRDSSSQASLENIEMAFLPLSAQLSPLHSSSSSSCRSETSQYHVVQSSSRQDFEGIPSAESRTSHNELAASVPRVQPAGVTAEKELSYNQIVEQTPSAEIVSSRTKSRVSSSRVESTEASAENELSFNQVIEKITSAESLSSRFGATASCELVESTEATAENDLIFNQAQLHTESHVNLYLEETEDSRQEQGRSSVIEDVPLSRLRTAFSGSWSFLLSTPPQCLRGEEEEANDVDFISRPEQVPSSIIEDVPLSRLGAAFPGSWSFVLSTPPQCLRGDEEEANDVDFVSRPEQGPSSIIEGVPLSRLRTALPGSWSFLLSTSPQFLRGEEEEANDVDFVPEKCVSGAAPSIRTTERLEHVPARSSTRPSFNDDVTVSRFMTASPGSWSFLLSTPSHFSTGGESDKESSSSCEDERRLETVVVEEPDATILESINVDKPEARTLEFHDRDDDSDEKG